MTKHLEIMKKEYVSPAIVCVEIKGGEAMLAASPDIVVDNNETVDVCESKGATFDTDLDVWE